MNNTIKELWHGNIIPQEDSRTNSKEMKELLGYMARHTHSKGISPCKEMKLTADNKRNNHRKLRPERQRILEKSFTDEQKEMFEKFSM